MNSEEREYNPGVCNIGAPEIRRRNILGWFGLVLTVAVYSSLVLLNLNPLWRLIIIAPSTFSALGFLQARKSFCVYFALLSVQNVGEEVGRTIKVESEDSRQKDRKRALQISAYSIVIGIIVTVIGYLLPF
ncbi:MAG: hypothetical protein ACFFBS_05405 [Promethearchaeota archaeon]